MFSIIFMALLLFGGSREPTESELPFKRPSLVIMTTGDDEADTYDVRFPSNVAPIKEQVRLALDPEPFVIVSSDDKRGSARIRTTRRGAFLIGLASAKVRPEITELPKECTKALVFLDLDLNDAERAASAQTYGSEPCPGAQIATPQQKLVLEGLDEKGRRLWVTVADDPRWTHAEAIGAEGEFETIFAGQLPVPVLHASFVAPIKSNLRRIAWHEVRKDWTSRKLGESEWAPIPAK